MYILAELNLSLHGVTACILGLMMMSWLRAPMVVPETKAVRQCCLPSCTEFRFH